MLTKINSDTIIQRLDSDIAETELDGNIVLLHIELGKYYNLNQTSSDLWRWLAAPITLDNLVLQLHEKYDCTLNQATEDVSKFLQHLNQLGLIKEVVA